MLSKSPVSAVLPCKDLKKARDFYVKKIGLTLVAGSPKESYLVFAAGEGTVLTCFESKSRKSEDTAAMFEVADLETEMAALRKRGVRFENYDLPHLKTVNGISTEGNHRAAWFKDPGGNVVGLHSGAMPAKGKKVRETLDRV